MSHGSLETRVCRLYGKGDLRLETESVAEPMAGEVRVAVKAGGICGSDLHYYQDGGFGPITVKQPIILGHEVAGTVEALGGGVSGLAIGQTVAINPSRPCQACRFCNEGLYNHCLNMRFFGSAMRMPHEQGAFRDRIVVDAAQCVPLSNARSPAEGACAEPLAVCLHAANQAGDIEGKRVLVTGAGPIGVFVHRRGEASRRCRGSGRRIFRTARWRSPRRWARRARSTWRKTAPRWRFTPPTRDISTWSSSARRRPRPSRLPSRAFRPRGRIIQVGVTGNQPVPINMLVAKEIQFVGTHRFHAEFAEAVTLIDEGQIDVGPMITHSIPVDRLDEAFRIAGDRTQAVKAQLTFDSLRRGAFDRDERSA